MSESEKRAYRFADVPMPSEYAEKDFSIDGGYAETGPLSFNSREWQHEPLDAITRYKEVYFIAPTRSGKSLLWHIVWAWFVRYVQENTLIVLADVDTVEGIFEERLKPSVKGTMRDLWSGVENDIRKDKILINGRVTRTASCRVENDLATFGSSLTIGDEVSKWSAPYDAIGMTRGRREDYKGLPGYNDRSLWVSSPKFEGDALHNEVNKGGVVHFEYAMPCPNCGMFHVLIDENIEELPNENGEKDHDPLRIKRDNAAAYICPHCKVRIEDIDRYDMIKRGRWITENEILDKDGNLIKKATLRENAEEASYQWNRLILPPEKYSFATCLSSFHAARTAADPKALEIYQNEHMARFVDRVTNKISNKYLATKVASGENEYSTTGFIPERVIAAVVGVDTQDAGFYYTIVGYGMFMESWVLRYGWIPCDMTDLQFKDNPEPVRERFVEHLYSPANTLVYPDGEILPIIGGLVDEGGHRERDVQYLCKKHPELMAYKGKSTRVTSGAMLERSKSKRLILGDTQRASGIISKAMESDAWHLPTDVDDEFVKQAANQFWKKVVDTHGNESDKFVSLQPDHYRDCLNYARLCAELHRLPVMLKDSSGVSRIKNTMANKIAEEIKQTQKTRAAQSTPAQPATPFTPRRRLWSRR